MSLLTLPKYPDQDQIAESGGTTNQTGNGGNGGSGVVIIRTPIAAISTTGSPTITTESSNTIYKFTGSGSITF